MATEGTYPFMGGGVSTWCHQICEGLSKSEFRVFAVTGDTHLTWRYKRMPSVKEVYCVPMWPGEEPELYLRPGPFSAVLQRRWLTTDARVQEGFVPPLRTLLREIFVGEVEIEELVSAIVEMGVYLREYDFKAAMRSQATWLCFVEAIEQFCDTPAAQGCAEPTIADITLCARWFYNMMMPIAAKPMKGTVFHATIASACALPGVIGRRHDGTSFVLTDHGVYLRERYIAISNTDFPQVQKRFLVGLAILFGRACYHVADIVSPVARFNSRWEIPFGCNPDKIRVIYNGVETDKFKPAPKPPERRSRPVAVAAARVFPLKDLETMIRGTDVARRKIPDLHTLAYGSLKADIPYVEKCRALIKELDVGDNFEFGGFHPDPYGIFIEGDISVLSSISEGFPYTVLEAMSSGIPCVATDVGGVREAVGDTGIVVPPKDPEAFGEAMVELLTQNERRKKLARASRDRVISEFTIAKQLANYQAVYDELHVATKERLAREATQ